MSIYHKNKKMAPNLKTRVGKKITSRASLIEQSVRRVKAKERERAREGDLELTKVIAYSDISNQERRTNYEDNESEENGSEEDQNYALDPIF